MDSQASFKKGQYIGDKTPCALEDKRQDNLGKSVDAIPFHVIGASTRGILHRYNDTPRDDAFTIVVDGTWLAVAVADGAGSRPLSRHGAALLANRLCRRLLRATKYYPKEQVIPDIKPDTQDKNQLESIVVKAFHQARVDLEKFAIIREKDLEDFHSTLLGLILNIETMEMGVGQIGDGLILGLDSNKKAVILAHPKTSDDPAASYFITQDDWEQYLYIRGMNSKEVDSFSTFYLMTDGVANDCEYGPPTNILEIWARDMDREIRLVPSLEKTAERLENYLANYKAKGSFDDRTLVVIYKT